MPTINPDSPPVTIGSPVRNSDRPTRPPAPPPGGPILVAAYDLAPPRVPRARQTEGATNSSSKVT